jgi:4-amino-4-deoxy-L-arabinose transferase-like glycosyltransferase
LNERRRQYLIFLVVACLTAVAMALRLIDLGVLGFFGDEETTALAARAVIDGSGSVMPTGMPYRRALPFTWLNAASASLAGLNQEFGYRLPAAILGTGTVLLLYFVTASIAGPGAGLLACTILAFSGWHLVWSRTARMYSPALLMALAFFFVCLRWQKNGRHRDLAAAVSLFLIAVFFHSAVVAIALFPILLAVLYDGRRITLGRAGLAAGFMVAAGWILNRFFVVVPYANWASELPGLPTQPASRVIDSVGVLLADLSPVAWPLLAAGIVVGVVWARQSGVSDSAATPGRRLVVTLLAGLAVSMVFVGFPAVGVTFALSALLVDQRGIRAWRNPLWFSVFVAGGVVGTIVRVTATGGGIRSIVESPFPYAIYLGVLLPALMGLFGIAAAWLAFAPPSSAFDDRPVRSSVLFILAYSLALGFAMNWAPWRYMLLVYPWIILVVSVALWHACEAFALRRRVAPIVPGIFVGICIFAGGIGGHGLPAARVVASADYGSRIPWNDQGMEIRPDHRGAGLFVREHLTTGDIVIAEDPLEQKWYVGQADFWFRAADDAQRYLFKDDLGVLRDFYVGSALLNEPPDAAWIASRDGAIWFVSSGETARNRDWYLSPEQTAWLAAIEVDSRPAYSGRDGLTHVYCFGRCPAGIPVARVP